MNIDVGYNYSWADQYTYVVTTVSADNPANANGVIDTARLKVTGTQNCYVGTFFGELPTLTSRDYVNLGALSDGEHTVTGLSIDVAIGDYIGGCADAIMIGNDNGHSVYASPQWQVWFGDGIEHTYSLINNCFLALYATGAETAAGQPFIKRFGGIPYAALNRGVW